MAGTNPTFSFTVSSVTLNNRELAAATSPLYRGYQKAAGRTRDRAKRALTQHGRIDTGRLRNSIEYEIKIESSAAAVYISASVGTRVTYGKFIHDGTANNGQGYIYPRRARMLRFQPKGGTRVVFADRVRGIEGTPYIADAIRDLTEDDFTVGG